MRTTAAYALAVMVALAGCSLGGTTHREQIDDEGGSYSSSLSLHGDSDEAMLERGKQAVMESRFDDAGGIFRELARKPSAKAEYREAALFELAELHANLLNPHRDPTMALDLFREFLERYPDSRLADRARDQIVLLEGGD